MQGKDERQPPQESSEILERFNLLRQSIRLLNQRIAERKRLAKHHKGKIENALRSATFDLSEHKSTWWQVESNPSASERRTFLEGQLTRLQEQLCRIDLESIDTVTELERERDRLLLEYLKLKQAAKSLMR